MATLSKLANANTVVTTGWTNPTNAYSSTDTDASATAAPAKNASIVSDFGFPAFTTGEIPDTYVLTGITAEVRYKASATDSTGATLRFQINNNGTLVGTESSNGMTLTFSTVTDTETSGVSLSDLRTANVVKVRVTGARSSSNNPITWSVDYVKLTVSYSPAGSITANAYIKKAQSGSVTADSNLRGTATGSFTANAYISDYPGRRIEGSLSADANIVVYGEWELIHEADVSNLRYVDLSIPLNEKVDYRVDEYSLADPYPTTVLSMPNLVAYWRHGESSGTTAVDASGNGRNGTYASVTLGTAGLLVGDTNTAATFSTAKMTTADTPFRFSSDFSVVGIVKPSAISGDRGWITRHYNSSGYLGWRCGFSDGKPTVEFSSDGTNGVTRTGSTARLANDTKAHIAFVYRASVGAVDFYLNGTLVDTLSGLPTSLYTGATWTSVLSVGLWDTNTTAWNTFAGVLDETAVFGRAVAPLEVAALYQASLNNIVTNYSLTTSTTITGSSISMDDWLLCGEDIGTIVVTPTDIGGRRLLQREDFAVLDQPYKEVQTGELLGITGSFTVIAPDGNRGSIERQIKAASNSTKTIWLKSPWGDVWGVAIGKIGFNYGSGSMTVEFVQHE